MMQVSLESYALRRRPEVGQCIREARSKKRWTQEKIAQYLGCSRRRVNRVEQGVAEFTLFEIELLAEALGVPLPDLMGRPKKN